jgi:hypothetical protein
MRAASTTTRRGISLKIHRKSIRTPGTEALLRVEETTIQIMWRDRVSSVTPFNVFDEGVEVLAKSLKEIPDELRIPKGLPNGGQGVRQFFRLVVVNGHSFIQLVQIS